MFIPKPIAYFVNGCFYLNTVYVPVLDINVIKNQINSLMFVKKVCETRIQRLQSGKVVTQYLYGSFYLLFFSHCAPSMIGSS